MYSAAIIKGKSFPRIKGKDISHQIYRLSKIDGLEIAILAYTGSLLDQPQEQFISTCKQIDCDYSIWNDYDLSRLLISEGFICPRDGAIIEGGICDCGYNPKREPLNLFQEEAIKELKLIHDLKQQKGLVVLPTGSGKTRVAALDIRDNNFARALYIAHTYEILDDAEQEFKKYYEASRLKVVRNRNQLSPLKKINFISIQLASRNLHAFRPDQFDYIIIDEFHHAAATSYRKVLEYFSPKFLLGLTATPFRGDREDILDLCAGKIVVNYELRDGIETGILSPYHYFGLFDNVDYSTINYKGKAYTITDLERTLIIPERDIAIGNVWKQKALNKPTLAFCCSQRHAERCCASFNKNSIPSRVILSSTPRNDREQVIEDFKNGTVKVIFTVDVFNEGVNFPFVECLLFLRPTESKRIFLQQLGRGLRRHHGKTKTIVLDFIGNFANAFKIVDYFGLSPSGEEDSSANLYWRPRTYKEIFDLPIGCEIHFDEKVLNIFAAQALDKANITRHNIHKILIQQFVNLCIKLKRLATWGDINKNCIIDSSVYKMLYKNPREIALQIPDILTENGIAF